MCAGVKVRREGGEAKGEGQADSKLSAESEVGL